jgi:adenylate cyclase
LSPIRRWLAAGRPATDEDRLAVLRFPRRFATGAFGIWIVGAIAFAALNLTVNLVAAASGAVVIVLGGMTACSLQYVLVERIMRPITTLALAEGLPRRADAPGVGSRLALVWLLTTGIPLLGIVVFTILGLTNGNADLGRVVAASLLLAAVALSVGLVSTLVAGALVAAPLRTMRDALANVERGDFATRVRVDDGTEVGLLQAGFNRMSDGLTERERLREAFGLYVDPDLTERVMREGTDLSGEELELSVLFLDIRDFTAFAERAGPQQVVARLNDLYGHVVPILRRHHGHANKFIGDGLLAVFGAPDRLADHAAYAVAAALDIVNLVNARYGGQLRIGIGVNSGPVVVGTIGGGGRLDFTVIGDTVNTAARVESATKLTGDELLITEATLRLLDTDTDGWVERPSVALKGKQQQVRLFGPSLKTRTR